VNDEFYIGYEPQTPSGLARRIRPLVMGVALGALLLSAGMVYTQGRFGAGVFEFGRLRAFEGHLVEHPYPALRVTTGEGGEAAIYWLVGQGKHGAADLVRGRDGHKVRVYGSLIQRDGESMIEVAGGATIATNTTRASASEPLHALHPITIQGEIVDSKCHLGVMKPGEGPTHRDCAVRCLLGDIPPMFVPHDGRELGRVSLVSADGRAFVEASAWAGKPVLIRGTLLQRGSQTFLAAKSVHALR
jgi:hypothetical protein